MYIGPFLRVESWLFEIVLYLYFFLILWIGRKILGKEKTMLFFWGSIIWTMIVENIFVIRGAYDYFAYANYYCFGDKLIAGFNGWASTILFVPLSISLGWFTFGFPAFIMSDRLLPNGSIWVKAIIGSIIMVSLDMLMDPLSVVNEWWRWTVPGYYLKGVSTGNYVGWFFMLFFYAVVYERTVMEKGSFAWLRPLEKIVFRRDTENLSDADNGKLGRVLYFRAVLFVPIMVATVMLCSAPLKFIGFNRYAPFNSVFPSHWDEMYPASARPAGMPSVSIADSDMRKVNGPRCEIGKGKSAPCHWKENVNHVGK